MKNENLIQIFKEKISADKSCNCDGKTFYCTSLETYLQGLNLDLMTRNLLLYIIEQVNRHDGEDNIDIKISKSTIIDVVKIPEKEWEKLFRDTLNRLFNSQISFESDKECIKKSRGFLIISNWDKGQNEDYFTINIPFANFHSECQRIFEMINKELVCIKITMSSSNKVWNYDSLKNEISSNVLIELVEAEAQKKLKYH